MDAQPDLYWSHIRERLALRLDTGSLAWQSFLRRLTTHFSDLLSVFLTLYGDRPDALWELEELIVVCFDAFERSFSESSPVDHGCQKPWYLEKSVVGAMCYTERFAGSMLGIVDTLPYLDELGIRYLHLMPPFLCPEERNDGGYAVSSYRELRPGIGHIDDIRTLANRMHHLGMKLVLDFVFNHTSDEHEWARRAMSGDPRYSEHYFFYPDRRQPDRYDRSLREIFPEGKRGSFVYHEESGQWVWSTFNPYQWDLNYRNPVVFRDMVGEMLFLANLGTDVLRLDALAFTWKEPDTSCENLPRVHTLIRAFKTAARIAAPWLEFKSEAIVHPDDVVKYVDVRECALSYNPLFMALSWESVATQNSDLLLRSLQSRYRLPKDCAWVNYVRSHDDIGWTFADEDAAGLGLHAQDHRSYLNHFYTDRIPGSFASGLPFQLNPQTGDCRVCGTTASLAGVEKALKSKDAGLLRDGVQRMLLLHAMMFSAGGIPLLYLGDEYGQLNDYGFMDSSNTADDSRWVHRPYFNWDTATQLSEHATQENWNSILFQGVRRLIQIRSSEMFPDDANSVFLDIGDPRALAIQRSDTEVVYCGVFNLSVETIEVQLPEIFVGLDDIHDAWTGRNRPFNSTCAMGSLDFFLFTTGSPRDETIQPGIG